MSVKRWLLDRIVVHGVRALTWVVHRIAKCIRLRRMRREGEGSKQWMNRR